MDRIMNIYYKRDLEANFLVIEDEAFEEDRFDLRMLEGNDLPFFLKLSLPTSRSCCGRRPAGQ